MTGTPARPARPYRFALVRGPHGSGPGSTVVRRLVPVLLLLPPAVAVLRWAADRTGVADGPTVLTATTVGVILVLVTVVARTVHVLDHADARQHELAAELRAERDFSATLLHAMRDGVVVLDAGLRVIDVSPRWCEMTGYPAADLVGLTPPYPWWPEDQAARLNATLGEVFSGAATGGEYELVYRRADGARIPVLVTLTAAAPGPDGRPRAYVTTSKDITERMRAAAALGTYAEQLEQANAELEQANKFKSDLMSMLSHEVGQPLTAIICFTELLTGQWDDLTDEARLSDVDKIQTGARRLFQLVGELMLMFRLDARAVLAGRAEVPVAEVVQAAVNQYATSTSAGVAVTVQVEPGLTVLADPGHLRQVLGHLLTNATRYGVPPVEVSAYAAGARVRVQVRDHGVGVPAEFVPQLFERFARAATTGATLAQGNGLGLFIVRQLVVANGGTVSYEPARPGSRFTVELDRALPVPGAAAAPDPADRLPNFPAGSRSEPERTTI